MLFLACRMQMKMAGKLYFLKFFVLLHNDVIDSSWGINSICIYCVHEVFVIYVQLSAQL